MTWSPELPDPNDWLPTPTAERLPRLFHHRCLSAERMTLLRAQLERETNLYNFDSGPGVEDILRTEIAAFLPDRYSVRAGVVSNEAFSAGDCDIVIFNSLWFPFLKAGATPESRRIHYPIEGVYGVLEVKQSLTAEVLDDALKKLVQVKRLEPTPHRERIVENRIDPHPSASAQPLFTAVVSTGLAGKFSFEDAVHRFVAINGQLPRRSVINALCVLGVGFATWVYDDAGTPSVAFFTEEDNNKHLSPLMLKIADPTAESALYELVSLILGHLHQLVLVADDVAVTYGAPQQAATPVNPAWNLHPDDCEHFR